MWWASFADVASESTVFRVPADAVLHATYRDDCSAVAAVAVATGALAVATEELAAVVDVVVLGAVAIAGATPAAYSVESAAVLLVHVTDNGNSGI